MSAPSVSAECAQAVMRFLSFHVLGLVVVVLRVLPSCPVEEERGCEDLLVYVTSRLPQFVLVVVVDGHACAWLSYTCFW